MEKFKERLYYVVDYSIPDKDQVYTGTLVNLPIIVSAPSLEELQVKAREIALHWIEFLKEGLQKEEPFDAIEVDMDEWFGHIKK